MMVCDTVVLAKGCSDHLLDGWSRKTASAWGRTVNGDAPPVHSERPCDAVSIKMHLRCIIHSVWREVFGLSLSNFHKSKEFLYSILHCLPSCGLFSGVHWKSLWLRMRLWKGATDCTVFDPALDRKGLAGLKACDSRSVDMWQRSGG